MSKSAAPSLAATVILLRAGGKHDAQALETLLLKRSPETSFMPGAWVFPGGRVEDSDGDDPGKAQRAAAVRELAEECGIELAGPEDLVLYSRWITPAQLTVRFDTYFFLAKAPAHAKPKPDGIEIVDAIWMAPGDALEQYHADRLPIMFPTLKHLEQLAGLRSVDEALNSAPSGPPEPIEPKLVNSEAGPRIALPGEPGYD